jgi:hypothetical protein
MSQVLRIGRILALSKPTGKNLASLAALAER